MTKANKPSSTFAPDLHLSAETAALLARLFPRWKGDTSEGVVAAPRNPRSPVPAAAWVLEPA